MLPPEVVIVGALIQILGSIGYVKETLTGHVKPHKVTWFLWALAPMIAFFVQLDQGVGIQSVSTLGVGLVTTTVFIASLINKKATWVITKVDYLCGFISLFGFFLWMYTKTGTIALLFSILADMIAAIPTIRKAYLFPESEHSLIYITGVINAVLGLLTITQWRFEYWGFLVYLFCVDTVLTVLVVRKFYKHKK